MGVIARQSIKGALANYIGVAIGVFVTFFVLTKYLTQEQIGLTRVLVDAAMLFSSLAQLGTNASIIRFFPYFKDNRNNHGIFGWSVLIPLIGFTLFALAFLIFRDPLLAVYSKNAPLLADYFYLLPMLTFFALYMTVFETNASVLMRITVPKLVREVGIRLFNLAAYLLLGFKVIELPTFVWIFCGSYGLAMLLNLFYLLSLGHISFRIDRKFLNRKKYKEIVLYTLFMTATVLAGNIPLFNSIFLGAKTSLALTGVYAIVMYIANVVEVPYRSLGAISRPVIATAVKEDNWDEVNRLGRQVSLHQLLVSLLVFYIIWINVDALFAIIPNGEEYRIGKYAVFILGLAKVVNSSFSVGTDILNYSRHYPWGLLFIAILTTSAIVLNYNLIDIMGIDGAACATLCSYVLYFLLLHGYLWRQLKVCIFSWGQLKTLALIVVLLLLDWGWSHWLTPALGLSVIVGALVKTLALGSLAITAVLLCRVSPTVNTMLLQLRKKL
jgi:O-antigen/teichoic acid export membrane protein